MLSRSSAIARKACGPWPSDPPGIRHPSRWVTTPTMASPERLARHGLVLGWPDVLRRGGPEPSIGVVRGEPGIAPVLIGVPRRVPGAEGGPGRGDGRWHCGFTG